MSMKSSGEVDHEGVGHSCLAQLREDDEQTTCNYYCNKLFGHMDLHATSHGNMRQKYFMAKDEDIDVGDRKYQVGERGIAEMCNLFCAKMGCGHVRYYPCESRGEEKCVYTTSDSSKDNRRHCVDELLPPPDKGFGQQSDRRIRAVKRNAQCFRSVHFGATPQNMKETTKSLHIACWMRGTSQN
ncbi:hypothetical protein PHMEG_0008676 [Phytophthora megakarya]|uniref:Uncharacterized protein n=1 Tax=Phytophthora megakarya TaxID=4795 RepID=A0A225WKL5_9STRA|nr:hypothetical protein PHMEG_0008676 [Phytophthora megakarya]